MDKNSFKAMELAKQAFEEDYRAAIRIELHDSGKVYGPGSFVQAVWARVDGQLLSILVSELLANDRDVTHEVTYSGSFTILWE